MGFDGKFGLDTLDTLSQNILQLAQLVVLWDNRSREDKRNAYHELFSNINDFFGSGYNELPNKAL